MAITIHQSPQTTTPGFNDIIFVVTSTSSTQANFQYVCDIYVTDDTGALTFNGNSYLREKTPADPITSSGVFNISNHIRNFLSYDIGDDIYGSQKSPNSVIQVYCKFGDEWGASSGVTVYAGQSTSQTFTVWNGVFDFVDFKNYLASQYSLATTNSTTKFLTNQPSTIKIRQNERMWIHRYIQTTLDTRYLRVVTWDGSSTTSYRIANNYFAQSTNVGERIIRLPIGWNLNSIPSADFAIGAQPILTSSIVSYYIYTEANTGTQNSMNQYINVDSTCTDHTIYRLHFLNKLGGFDSFSFIRAHTFDTEIKREKFKRNTTTRIGGGNYGYNKSSLSDVNYLVTNKDTVKVISDWISEADATWLEELVTSPVVFLDDPTDGLIAINITDSKYTRKQWLTDKLFNLEVTFQYGYDRYRQTL